jgi:4'-phosphopantetheinyl transferase
MTSSLLKSWIEGWMNWNQRNNCNVSWNETGYHEVTATGLDAVQIFYGTDSFADLQMVNVLLTPEELAFAKKFRNELQSRTWLSCRTALRLLLAINLGEIPKEIELRKNHFGKLYVPNSNLFFNVSHTDKSFLLGFNKNGRIGVDLEYLTGREDIPLLIGYAFSWQETDFCNQGNAPENFLKIWTLKEAYLKATGVGLVDYLKSVNVYGAEENEITNKQLHQNNFTCPNDETASLVYRNEKPIDYIWLK